MPATGQQSVSFAPGYQREGMLSNNQPFDAELCSRVAEVAIKAGRFVIGGTDPITQCVLPSAAGNIPGKLLGIAMWDPSMEPASPEYAIGAMVTIVKKGKVWMKAEDAVTFGNTVFVRYTVNGGLDVGRVRSDADTAKAGELLASKFHNTVGGTEGWVEVEINLP